MVGHNVVPCNKCNDKYVSRSSGVSPIVGVLALSGFIGLVAILLRNQ